MKESEVLKKLEEFIAIQSVSADPARRNHIKKAVNFLKTELESLGFTVHIIAKAGAPPLVYGKYITTSSARTIGIYGHYDVQPEDPVDEWKSDPFVLTRSNGKLFARGVADDKGHVIQNLVALRNIIQRGDLKNNIMCLFEGEEETGSPHMEGYVQELLKELGKVDVFYITDMGMYERNIPQIFYALRGLVYFELEIVTGTRDLHSGSYGNKVLNPLQITAQLFASMKDPQTHKVLIPSFYDDVTKPSDKEIKQLNKIAKSPDVEKAESGVFKTITVDGVDPYLSAKIFPSLDINGMFGGYTGAGAKTVIPYSAHIKFSCRLVEHQDPHKIAELVKNFIKNSLPEGVQHSLKVDSVNAPFYTNINNEFVRQTSNIFKDVFGHEVIFSRSGGSIPSAEIIQRLTHKPVILTGFILPDNNLHSPNENYDEEMFWKGIVALEKVYGS